MEHIDDHHHQQPHVVVVPYPSQGHINPLLQFAKRLASKGVRSTIATTFSTVGSINGAVINVRVEPISDGFDRGEKPESGREDVYLNAFRENGSRTLSQIIHKYEDSSHPVTCIVYDSFLPWALDVARQHGVYGAAFFTNSTTVCAVFCYIHHGRLSLPVKHDDFPVVLPGLPPLNSVDVPSFIKAPESCPAYLAMKMNQFSNLVKADWIFNNSFLELEAEAAKSVSELLSAKLIGPMVPSAYLDGRMEGDYGYGASLWKPLSGQCVEWLQNKPRRSVVFISFGSMVSLPAKQMEEIAIALKGGDFNFLWVVRETEHGKFPDGFMASIQGKGLIVSWCNQLEMLVHPAIGSFVTHCGWNSTLEGLSLGVPMVGVPQWADQMTDAKFIEEIWGVGVRAKEDEFGIVTRDELLYCLKQVMEGDKNHKIRENAEKWRESAKAAAGEHGSSDQSINEFVHHLQNSKRKEH